MGKENLLYLPTFRLSGFRIFNELSIWSSNIANEGRGKRSHQLAWRILLLGLIEPSERSEDRIPFEPSVFLGESRTSKTSIGSPDFDGFRMEESNVCELNSESRIT
jgi:hypothetical protein